MRSSAFFLFVLLFFKVASGQVKDSTTIPNAPTVHHSTEAKKALLFSLIPGGGQFYNHKYWKIPLIYATFGTLGYFVALNSSGFNACKNEYKFRVQNPNFTPGQVGDPYPVYQNYGLDDLLTLKNTFERYRNTCIVAIVGVYVLNLVDAAVDAHLRNFDISPSLSMQMPNGGNGHEALSAFSGLKISYHF